MNRLHPSLLGFGLLTIFAVASLGTPQEPSELPKNEAALQDPIEVQTRGPLHEAFAQPFDVKPEPGPMIPKEPPPPIPEEAPEQRPEAENAQWIPGYWAWDSERKDYLWVSGVYRVPPQDRTFIPGYWQHTPEGWRWIPGFWSNANQQELPYTPEPPAPLDNGPSMPAPDDDSAYIPGSWVYRDTRFVWRPGFYSQVQVGRVWTPSRYLWTPNGYLFNDGYWDYPFEDRGLIFAPVYFHRPLWQTAGWCYRPGFVVGFNSFFDSAFVGIGGFHFHFGNYYDPFYARNGFRPWYNGRGRYDTMFAHHGRYRQGNNPNWVASQQRNYADRSAGRAARPPLNFAQQNAQGNGKKGQGVVTPINQFTNTKVRLVNATPAQRDIQQTQVQKTREIAQNRQKTDAVVVNNNKVGGGNSGRGSEAKSLNLSNLREGKSNGPSTRIETPRSVTSPPVTKNFTPKNDGPRNVTPPPVTKNVTPKNDVPRNVTPPPVTKNVTPKNDVPRNVTPPPVTKIVTPKIDAPRNVTPPPVTRNVAPPKASPPRQAPPPPPPRQAPPPPRPAPSRPKKASVDVDPPRVVTKSAPPVQRTIAAPVSTPRAQSSPVRAQPAARTQPVQRSQPAPRVSTPARNNPAPARSSPPPRPANTKKR